MAGPANDPTTLTTSTASQSSSDRSLPIPNNYLCPITHCLLLDPVVASDGHSYDRAAITEWLHKGNRLSPTTDAPLSTTLFDNLTLKTIVCDFHASLPASGQDPTQIRLREEAIDDLLKQGLPETRQREEAEMSEHREADESLELRLWLTYYEQRVAQYEQRIAVMDEQIRTINHYSRRLTANVSACKQPLAPRPALIGFKVSPAVAAVASLSSSSSSLTADSRTDLVKQARLYEAKQDHAAAFIYWRQAADRGHPHAMWVLANRLHFGWLVIEDKAAAEQIFLQLAKAGHVGSQGWCYAYGKGGYEENRKQAIECYQQFLDLFELDESSSSDSDSNALVLAGLMHAWPSNNSAIDKVRAKPTFLRAVNLGNAVAMYYMHRMEDQEVMAWLLKSAQAGYAEAQQELGSCYSMGWHLADKDIDLAVYWYLFAARQGHRGAIRELREISDEKDVDYWPKATEAATKFIQQIDGPQEDSDSESS